MKILITGGAGFIGYHVSRYLLDKGHIVLGVDNMYSHYYDVDIKQHRLNFLYTSDQYDFSSDMLDLCFKNERITENIDVVIHLAACASIHYAKEQPEQCVKDNIELFSDVLNSCEDNKIKHVIFPRTTGGMDSIYATTKRMNEFMAHGFSNKTGIQTTGLRFCSVYGEWGRPDMAIWKFTQNILEGKPIDVFESGKTTRDFTYVDDICRGIDCVLNAKFSRLYNEFDVGTGRSSNILQVIRIIQECTGKQALLNNVPIPEGYSQYSALDISKIQEFGYSPQVSLKDGVERFVNWYKEYNR